jgi:hypothetical protein
VLTGLAALLPALLLALGAAGPAGMPATGPSQPDPAGGSAVSVTMTVMNEGHPVSLLDQRHPGWAHTGIGDAEKVTVTVHVAGTSVHQWRSHLEAPDAFQGLALQDCRGDEEAPPEEITCVFPVSAATGPNLLHFSFTADDGRVVASADGYLMGGEFDWDTGWEVLDATGQWSAIARSQIIALPATMSSALRYVVTNTGDIPFRVTNGCDTRLLQPHTQLVCLERGVRPVQSLARDYHERLRLVDVVGATAEPDIDTTIRSFAGIFSLAAPSVTVGQAVVVSATGLPNDFPFVMQFRIDDEPVLVGTTTSSTGRTRLSFPLPSTSQGTAHLEVIHDGLTIASLPFDVTLVPRKADAAAPVWPWLLVLLVVLVGLLTLILVRRRRNRTRITASRAPPDPDPYPGAIPARQEPAGARRS